MPFAEAFKRQLQRTTSGVGVDTGEVMSAMVHRRLRSHTPLLPRRGAFTPKSLIAPFGEQRLRPLQIARAKCGPAASSR